MITFGEKFKQKDMKLSFILLFAWMCSFQVVSAQTNSDNKAASEVAKATVHGQEEPKTLTKAELKQAKIAAKEAERIEKERLEALKLQKAIMAAEKPITKHIKQLEDQRNALKKMNAKLEKKMSKNVLSDVEIEKERAKIVKQENKIKKLEAQLFKEEKKLNKLVN